MWSEPPWGSARMRAPIAANSPCSGDGEGIEFRGLEHATRVRPVGRCIGVRRDDTFEEVLGSALEDVGEGSEGICDRAVGIDTPVLVIRPGQESLELVLEHDVAPERDHDVRRESRTNRRGEAEECHRVVDAPFEVQVGEVVGDDGRVERLGERGERSDGARARARALPLDEEDALASEAFRERAPVGFPELETMPGDHADVREVRQRELHTAVALDRHVEVDRTTATLPGCDECFVDHPIAVPAVALVHDGAEIPRVADEPVEHATLIDHLVFHLTEEFRKPIGRDRHQWELLGGGLGNRGTVVERGRAGRADRRGRLAGRLDEAQGVERRRPLIHHRMEGEVLVVLEGPSEGVVAAPRGDDDVPDPMRLEQRRQLHDDRFARVHRSGPTSVRGSQPARRPSRAVTDLIRRVLPDAAFSVTNERPPG